MMLFMAELDLLLAKEIASELRVSERTLYSMVQDGMPCFQARKTLLFDRERVFKWLIEHERHGGKRISKNKVKAVTP
jgi:phage terminase Nu1 subunit (DNA packaging protein)